MTVTVSVVIPTWNRAREVRRALASVHAQSRAADQIVVVDDGSTDETRVMLADEDRIEVLRCRHRGVSAARNEGIRGSTGSWIAFLDSDDEWTSDKLEQQVAAVESSPTYRICHTDEIWVRNGRRVNPRLKHRKSGGWMYERCLPLCAISPSAVMIERGLFGEIGGFDESLPACEDYDLWLRICSRYPVLYVERPLTIKHGGHSDQLSSTVPALDRYRIRALRKILEQGHAGTSSEAGDARDAGRENRSFPRRRPEARS